MLSKVNSTHLIFSHFEELEININESTVKEIKENMLKLINLREKMRKAIKAGIK